MIWYSILTVIYHNFPNHCHTVALEDISNLALNHLTLKKLYTQHHNQMNKSTHNIEEWDTLWLPLPKHKSGGFSTMGKHLHPSAWLSTNPVLINHQPQYKQISFLLKVLLPLLSYKKVQGNRYDILFDEGLGKKKVFVCILETGNPKHGVLIKNIPYHITINKYG